MCSTSSIAAGKLELELVPQGNLAERIRAAGAGIGAFFRPTAFGTRARRGQGDARDRRPRLRAGVPDPRRLALIKAERGDRWGNLVYRMTARNFGPMMATAAKTTVATVHRIVELGELDPEAIVTPGIYVDRIVKIERVATKAGGFRKAA